MGGRSPRGRQYPSSRRDRGGARSPADRDRTRSAGCRWTRKRTGGRLAAQRRQRIAVRGDPDLDSVRRQRRSDEVRTRALARGRRSIEPRGRHSRIRFATRRPPRRAGLGGALPLPHRRSRGPGHLSALAAVSSPDSITTVISDFGGVLTTPLVQSFAAVQDETGIPFEELAKAMARIEEEDGRHPLFELETGRLTEVQFLQKLGDSLEPVLGHRPELHRLSEIYLEGLHRKEPMIDLMREAKSSGHRMGLLTNNVREWEPLWRSMLPVDEIFEAVVDSGFVGLPKPDPQIYELMLERLDGVPAQECLFIDDVDVNCAAARELGMSAVHYQHNEKAIPEIRKALSLQTT